MPKLFYFVDLPKMECEQCILSKSHKFVYPAKSYTHSKPFYLILSDVWGPSKVKNNYGKRWFVTFIDDHTRI